MKKKVIVMMFLLIAISLSACEKTEEEKFEIIQQEIQTEVEKDIVEKHMPEEQDTDTFETKSFEVDEAILNAKSQTPIIQIGDLVVDMSQKITLQQFMDESGLVVEEGYETGWLLSGEEKTIDFKIPQSSSVVTVSVVAPIYNGDEKQYTYEEAYIDGILVDNPSTEYSGIGGAGMKLWTEVPNVYLSNGIHVGSTMDEVAAVWGEPTYKETEDGELEYIYLIPAVEEKVVTTESGNFIFVVFDEYKIRFDASKKVTLIYEGFWGTRYLYEELSEGYLHINACYGAEKAEFSKILDRFVLSADYLESIGYINGYTCEITNKLDGGYVDFPVRAEEKVSRTYRKQ